MNLENLKSSDFPFKHWEFSDCLDIKALDEISYSTIPPIFLSDWSPLLLDWHDNSS